MHARLIKGDWLATKDQIQAEFGELTEDDLRLAAGNVERVVETIQRRYDYTVDQASRAWDDFAARVDLVEERAGERFVDGADDVREATSPYDANLPHHDVREALRLEEARDVARSARKDF